MSQQSRLNKNYLQHHERGFYETVAVLSHLEDRIC